MKNYEKKKVSLWVYYAVTGFHFPTYPEIRYLMLIKILSTMYSSNVKLQHVPNRIQA